MAYTLSNLIRDGIQKMGRPAYHMLKATGGSTTTVIDTNLDTQYIDSDSAVNGTVLVTYDAGGASAAPENEYARVSSFAESTLTLTVDTLTSAVASGDRVMFISSQYPLIELERMANQTLQDMGRITLIDTSLTSADNQTEYTIPAACRGEQIVAVHIQTNLNDANDNRRIPITGFQQVQDGPSGTPLLIMPQLPAGYTIYLTYNGIHPTLTAYSSAISDTIEPKRIVWKFAENLWRWKQPTSQAEIQRMNEAISKAEEMERMYPVYRTKKRPPQNVYGNGDFRRRSDVVDGVPL